MRNLKKVLSTIMAAAMLMSVVVFNASAAFSDQNKIENTDAVNMNVALKIINGLPDGSFNPTGNVTRAEMAKMICVALNGGNEPSVTSKAGNATFSDIRGHWAEGYIEYCAALGIVAGMGDGTFAPDASVTATQAAKMLLVILGYNAEAEGFNGSNWTVKINVRASQKSLYEDADMTSVNNPLSRDNAAQMVYNTLDAVKVEYDYQLTTVNGVLVTTAVLKDVTAAPRTLLADKFDALTKYTYLVGMSYDSKKAEFTYTYDSTGGTLPYAIPAADQLGSMTLKSKTDYSDLIGQQVKVIYKNNTAKDVYGIFADVDSKVLATGILGDIGTIKTDSFKLDGTVYKLDNTDATTPIYAFTNNAGNWAGLTLLSNLNAITGAQEPFTAKAIDADNDGKVDYFIAVPFTVAKVTFVGTTAITAGNVSYKFEDHNIASDIKKDDYAIITAAVNTAKDEAVLVKADVVTGTVKAIESATKITLDSTVYVADAGYTPPTFGMNDNFKLVVVNGYFFNATKVSTAASSKNVALVTAQSGALNAINGTMDVQLLFADGTKNIVKVEKVNIASGGALGTVKVGNTDTTLDAGEVVIGQIYTYEVNSDGYYELSMIVAADYDQVAPATGITATSVSDRTATGTTVTTIKDGKAATAGATYYFNDDAVVFYYNGSSYKATTGATVNKWADLAGGAITDGILYANKTSGFNKTEIALLTLIGAPDAGDAAYGWVVSNPVLVKDGDDYYLQLKIWNGTSVVTMKAEKYNNSNTGTQTSFTPVASGLDASSLTHLKKGNPVTYSDSGNGIITNLQGFAAAANAVTAYTDGKDDVVLSSVVTGATLGDKKLVTIEKDTVILFVDTANNEGLTGGSITVASEPVAGGFINNCYVLANGSNEIKAIIVDTTNEITGLVGTLTPATPGGFATDGKGVNGNKIGQDAPTATNIAAHFTDAIGANVTGATAVVYAADGTAYTFTIVAPFNDTAVTQAALTTALKFDTAKTGADLKTAANALLTAGNGVTSYTVAITAGAPVGALEDATNYTADLTLTFVITAANGETVTITGVTADLT